VDNSNFRLSVRLCKSGRDISNNTNHLGKTAILLVGAGMAAEIGYWIYIM